MKGGKRKRSLMFYRWQHNSLCHWCKRPMVLILRPPEVDNRKFPPRKDEATIDHLYSRLHEKRGSPGETTVLACWECNQLRCHTEMVMLSKEELWERSGSPPWELRGGLGK